MVTLAAAAKIASALPGVTIGTRWNNRTWLVGERGFVWQRPLSKADIKRFGDEVPPSGDILGIIVESLDAKDALLAMELPGFFTIPHFNNYPAVLVELRRARIADVRAAIKDAYRVTANKPTARTKATPRRAAGSRRSKATRARRSRAT